MSYLGIPVEHTILVFVLLLALAHFIMPLLPFTCGDLFSFCGLRRKQKKQLTFCKERARYWKWKLRFFAPEGEYAAILLTMVRLGQKHFAKSHDAGIAQHSCAQCKDSRKGLADLDRAARAFRSAEQIRMKCTFRLSFGRDI